MRRMFATLDGVLIDRLFQPLCDFMHERFALGLLRCRLYLP